MAGYVETNTRMFVAGAALVAFRRVKLSSGKLAYAGLAERELGILMRDAFADGDLVPVLLRTAAGTMKVTLSEAASAGAVVYTAANGKVQDTAAATAYPVGEILEAASGDGSIVECLRLYGDTANP